MAGFIALIFKNILRQKTRTLLTVLGISIGIATIVSLGVITEGLKDSIERVIKTGEADFTVAQARVADLSFSIVTTDQIEAIRDTSGIEQAAGMLMAVVPTEKTPYFILLGIERADAKLAGLNISKGRLFNDGADEIVVGKIGAQNLDVRLGDDVVLKEKSYKVVGLYQTGNAYQDGGGFIPLDVLQQAEHKEGQVTMVLVNVSDNVKNIKKFTRGLERRFHGKLATITSAADISAVDQGLEIVDFTSRAISILAVVIGGIGVMNTIMMSVFERTREIGILRAIGWKRRRVLAMVMGESLALGVISIGIGIGLGLLAVQYVMSFPTAQSFLKPDYGFITFERAIIVGVLVSLIGGLYPAYRATRFSPAEALRYE